MEEGYAAVPGSYVPGRREQPALNPKEHAWCLRAGEEAAWQQQREPRETQRRGQISAVAKVFRRTPAPV